MKRNVFGKPPVKNRYDEADLYKFKKPAYSKNDLEVLNRMLKKGGFGKRASGRTEGTFLSGSHVIVHPERNQRVIFKMSYSTSEKTHDAYIKFYMPQMDKEYVGEKPVLFGMTEEEYNRYKTPLHFKCILSPENQSVDLETLVRSFVKRLEYQTGCDLVWRGAVHTDTAHRHVHVVINGNDKNGNAVYFNRETVGLMRLMCENAATALVGIRSAAEIQAAKQKTATVKRWTPVDKDLSMLAGGEEFFIEKKGLTTVQENRLAFLCSINLAEQKKNGWELKKDWQDVLQASGRYNVFFEEYLNSANSGLVLYKGEGIRNAIVEKTITFDKNESWNDALIVQSNGKRIFIPVWQLHKTGLEGKRISITGKEKPSKSIGRQVSDKNIFVER